ncbi:hypothetical protein D5366_07525 [Neokomagataea tanensis]|uniref:Flagellar assembly protein FliO n=1 Tax=Neokomagataea tanensis TaxID=661191 RepID=A0A4Y6V9P6_9PROT|nr:MULTISPECIES: flagellar biosynthetic protein FliO [Neokomagataea]QDH25085.1 hypothetical protein D5366_07525 [Neokomagataea tanensis]
MSLHQLIFACIMLCIILGIIVGLKPFLARFSSMGGKKTSSEKLLVLEAQLALDRVRRLSLVQCGQKQILVLSGGTTDVLLDCTQASGFASLLEEAP